jgi:hypothetical protein
MINLQCKEFTKYRMLAEYAYTVDIHKVVIPIMLGKLLYLHCPKCNNTKRIELKNNGLCCTLKIMHCTVCTTYILYVLIGLYTACVSH